MPDAPSGNRDDIVSNSAICKMLMLRQEILRGRADAPASLRGYGLDRGFKIPAGLDLHKGQKPPAARNQVDFASPAAKPRFDY